MLDNVHFTDLLHVIGLVFATYNSIELNLIIFSLQLYILSFPKILYRKAGANSVDMDWTDPRGTA